MTDIHLSSLNFDRGIDRITHAGRGTLAMLPEREQAPPPDTGTRPQLEALLALPTLDDVLNAAVRPQLQNRDLLVPTRFRQALEGALEHLGQAAQDAQDAQDMSAAQPTDERSSSARTLNRAVRLLKEESALRDLLQMYRSALYQG